MPVVPGLTTTVPAGRSYYRITSLSFLTTQTTQHKRVVNGEGARRSRHGARYNYPGARTVYLAEDLTTCLAEKMFCFQREVLTGIDSSHISGVFPPFQQRFALWEVVFQNAIPNVFDLSLTNASAVNVIPSLMLNPSQDYHHLKDRRAAIESDGYLGLRAPSSRVRGSGHMIVLFEDQSRNVGCINPFAIEFRMITSVRSPTPFTNHALEIPDFTAGEVQVISPTQVAAHHPAVGAYDTWTRVEFNY
jgi:RES domain